MLDLGASPGFGAWSLGFRDRFVAISIRLSGPDSGSDKGVKEHPRVVPIARAVFHPSDCIRISCKQTLDQSRGDANHRDWRNVVEINFQSRITDTLHHFAEVAVETFIADILVIKGRQH